MTGFFMGGGDSAYSWGRKPVDLRISTDQSPADEDDFLNSQQATPTAETYNDNSNDSNKQFGPPPIKKEKPRYEFHSPSELLQDPNTYQSMVPELPESLDRLPSVAGSELGGKEVELKLETPVVESTREVEESLTSHEDRPKEQNGGLSSFLAGAGFASVVDTAVSAAVRDTEPTAKHVDEHEPTLKELNEDPVRLEQVPTSSKPESVGGFGNIVDAAVAAAVSKHVSHDDVIDFDHDQSIKASENIAREHTPSSNAGLFAGNVDAAVVAAAGEDLAEAGLAKDVEVQESAAQGQETEEIPPPEPTVEEDSKTVAEEVGSGTSKKQKRKDKKKKKKSKDLDAPADDNDEVETTTTTTASISIVELDSSAQPEPVAERAAEPIDEPSTVAEQQQQQQQHVSEEIEIKDNTPEISNDQLLAAESQVVVEETTREIELPSSNVGTEAVTASAENEQTTASTNDQSPHVAAVPEDEGSASVAATASKSSKKKKKNKKKSLSLSESVSSETPEAASNEPQVDTSVIVTEEPKSIDEPAEEKPVPESSSASMPAENLEVTATEDVTPFEEKQQPEPEVSESVEKSASVEGDAVAVEQDSQVTSGIEQNQSPDSPVDEWFDSAETAEVQPTEPVEIAQEAAPADKEIQTLEVSQDTTASAEPVETKQEEEPVTTSSSKKKNKKKKKGQSLSIDETAPQETTQEPSETAFQSQPESAEAPSHEGEVVQPGDSENQSKDVEEALAESSGSLPVETEESAPKTDDISISAVPEVESTTEVSEAVAEAVTESEPSVIAPEQTEEAIEPQTIDAPAELVSSETYPSEADTISSDQLTKEIEAAEATPTQEIFEEVSSTLTKSKKKKGKKGKRVSWAEGADFAVMSEPETPASEETAPVITSEEPLPTAEEETVVPASAEPELPIEAEAETSREVEADVPTPAETIDSAGPSSVDAEPALTFEPSSTPEFVEKERSTEAQPEQKVEEVENLEDQPISLLSDFSQPGNAKELPEEEADQSESASSKSKRKKDKKKDKKKKKAAELALAADEEPSQPSETPVEELAKDVVEQTPAEVAEPTESMAVEQLAAEEKTADIVPAETAEPQIPEVSEPIELTPVEQPTTDEKSTDDVPADAPEPQVAETSVAIESTPADQPIVEEQIPTTLLEDASEPQTPVTADEVRSTDIPQEDDLVQESSKSKKKKDKKKKKAAAAAVAILSTEQVPPETPVTEEAKETTDTLVSDNAERTEDATVEEPKLDDAKEINVEELVAEQILEEPVQQSTSEPAQETVQEPVGESVQEPVEDPVEEPVPEPVPEPVEETKVVDLADDVPTQETSKSKKKKDKKKKKAAEALLQEEELLKEEPSDSSPTTPVEAPEQMESASQDHQLPDEQKTEDDIAASTEDPQPTEVSAEEVKTPDVTENDEWPQETSKSKKKKDKKKKKAAALPLDEEPTPSLPVVEEAEAKPIEAEAEAETPEPQELPVISEVTKEITEEQTAEPQTAEMPVEDVKPVDNAEDDDGAQETSSKSKKKKDKKKKKTGAALPWDEPQTPVNEDVAETVETSMPETQDLPAVEEPKLEYVPNDKDVVAESTESPVDAVSTESQDLPVAVETKSEEALKDQDVQPEIAETPVEDAKEIPVAEDEWAQETSSKSKKKKDKKKKKAAEVLPLDEEPAPSEKPIDDQPPVDTAPLVSQAPEETIVDDKKPDDSTEVQGTETQIPETPAEETKQVDTPEDDSWSQETSKSKKKKDKKKNRKSLQLEVAQEESTPDVAVEETKDTPETTPAVEAAPVTEDVTAAVDEQTEVDTADLQTHAVPQEESAPVQAEIIEDEGSTSKSSKAKKKKNKKNKSKDEPMPWDEEPSVKTPEIQQEPVTDQPVTTDDAPIVESARDLETDEIVESTEQEKQESEQPTEIIAEGEGLPVSTHAETLESTMLPQSEQPQLPTGESVSVQPEESANQDSLNATELAELQPPTDITETTDAVEESLHAPPTPVVLEDTTTNDNESSQAKSGKKSKKKKKRDSLAWDDEATEQQESSTTPIAVEGGYEIPLNDSQEKQPEPASTEEIQSQQEPAIQESKDLDSVDANADLENEGSAAVTEPTRQLSAKEKRKEKKKQKRCTLDLADEPSPAVADDIPEVTASVEPPMLDDQQKDDTEAPDDFAPVGKKKGKKNKRQSVSWEEEIIQAVAEEEPKPDETEQATEESDSKTPPLNEDLESGPSQTENELQETPVEVEGKETFQSSEETHTDQKEKDFDWTDNMVSPQVQSQTEESPFPVRFPISDERDDPDQIHPTTTVDDSQSHEIVIPDTVVEDQLPAAGQQDEGPTELSTPDVQSVKQEAEDIDWTASKSSKKNKKKKKQKSIATMPDESIITEESSPKTPLEQDDNPNTEPEFVQTDQPREIQEEHAVVEDSPLIPDSVSLQVVDNEQPRETQEEPSVVEEVPLVSEPAPPMEAIVEEEFKPSSSSKKKGKKNKKKSDAWSLEELGESIENKNIDQLPAQQSSDSVEEVIAIDSDKTEVPEETPLAPEPAQEEIVEDTTVIPKEIQEEKVSRKKSFSKARPH